jgi:hypothetical protein
MIATGSGKVDCHPGQSGVPPPSGCGVGCSVEMVRFAILRPRGDGEIVRRDRRGGASSTDVEGERGPTVARRTTWNQQPSTNQAGATFVTSVSQPQPRKIMSKSQDSKKQIRKAPLLTPKEKKAAKLAKKAR